MLNGCANSLAFLGPASTSDYWRKRCSISRFIRSKLWSKKTNWKNSFSTCIGLCKKHNPENKKEKCIEFIDATNTKTCAAVKENLSETRKKIVKIKNTILDKSKIENLAKQSDLIKR